jgi:hypothetical protein
VKGKEHSTETRAKLGKALKGKKLSVDHLANISKAKRRLQSRNVRFGSTPAVHLARAMHI